MSRHREVRNRAYSYDDDYYDEEDDYEEGQLSPTSAGESLIMWDFLAFISMSYSPLSLSSLIYLYGAHTAYMYDPHGDKDKSVFDFMLEPAAKVIVSYFGLMPLIFNYLPQLSHSHFHSLRLSLSLSLSHTHTHPLSLSLSLEMLSRNHCYLLLRQLHPLHHQLPKQL